MKKVILPGQKVLPLKEATSITHKSAMPVTSKNRSREYINLFTSLDHSSLSETGGMESLMAGIREEFGTAELQSLPQAIVAKCYLGNPYEVHTLDLGGQMIIHHYKKSESLPGHIEKARSLALHHAYSLVEVYTDKLIVVNEDGSTIKL